MRSWHIVNQLKQFADVTVVVPGVDTLTGHRVEGLGWRPWISEQTEDRVRVIRVNSLPNIRTNKIGRALYYLSFSSLQFLRSIFMRRFDAVITTSMPISTMFLGWLLARRHRAIFVLDVRDLPTDLALELGYFRDGVFSRAMVRLERFVVRRAQLVAAVSKGMADILKARLRPEQEVHVVPIGFDALEEGDGRSTAPWGDERLDGRFVVLYSGTMGYVVDVETVLDAAKIVRDQADIVFLFVGDGQRLEEYRRRAEDDSSRCVFMGRVSKSSIAGICRRADACVYPLVDGRIIATLLGNKIFDYMGAGKATIYTGPTGDVSRLLDEAKGGICLPPAAPQLLAETIIDLRGDPVACERMGNAARDYVMHGLTARDTTRRLAALIEAAIR